MDLTRRQRPGGRREEFPKWGVLRRRCLHVARSLGSCEGDAEDLAQEAMVRLVSVLPAVERPEAWLQVVVHNLFRRQQRRRANREQVFSQLAGARDGIPSQAASWRAQIDVGRLLVLLRPGSRRLLELVLAGHTHREIAAVVGCEIHQVGPRIQRALATVRRRLTDMPGRAPKR